jgi:hypothetical protein
VQTPWQLIFFRPIFFSSFSRQVNNHLPGHPKGINWRRWRTHGPHPSHLDTQRVAFVLSAAKTQRNEKNPHQKKKKANGYAG